MYAQLQTEIEKPMYVKLQTEININNVCTVTDRDKHKQCMNSYTQR